MALLFFLCEVRRWLRLLARLPHWTWFGVSCLVTLLVSGPHVVPWAFRAVGGHVAVVIALAIANIMLALASSALGVVSSDAACVLVCGGEACRDELGARLGAALGANGLAFFSSGHYKSLRDFDGSELGNPHRERFQGVDFEHLCKVIVLDRQAIDTLANFTSFLRHLRGSYQAHAGQEEAMDVVVVTSRYHALRACSVAAVILGSQGLSFVLAEASPGPGSSPEEHAELARRGPRESWLRVLRDVLRAVVWVFTGFEGDAVAAFVHKNRRDFRSWHSQRQSESLLRPDAAHLNDREQNGVSKTQ
ncbi:unnamed protein product [Polarella glacialis]|uniref:DUF218 domain-containing protein n=1 Tax=Polarella glacialis TaxID=89957 RepID=A0A813GR71_POLGL|nr:unnamed protein product [Polarella glacialis]